MPKANTGDELQYALSVFRHGLERGGCLVCRALADAESRSLHSFLYEGMTTAHVLVRFLAGGGFCAQHFRRAMRLGVNRWSVGCVELAILCRQVLPRASGEAQEIRAGRRRGRLFPPAGPGRKQAAMFPGRNCIFCLEGKEREDQFVRLLEWVAEREEFSRAISAGGTCLPHGTMALAAWSSHARVEKLWEILQARSAQLAGEINAFLEKYDERHRKEAFGAEIDAVEHAADFLAGWESEPRLAERERHSAAPALKKP